MDSNDWIDSAIAAIGNMMGIVRSSMPESHRNTTLLPNERRQSIDWPKRRHLEQRMHGPRPYGPLSERHGDGNTRPH